MFTNSKVDVNYLRLIFSKTIQLTAGSFFSFSIDISDCRKELCIKVDQWRDKAENKDSHENGGGECTLR